MKNLFTLLVLFSANLALSQQSADYFKQAGIKHYDKNEYKEAIEAFTLALVRNNKMNEVYIYRGIAKDAIDDFEGAIKDFNSACSIDCNDVFVYVERAKTYLNMKKTAEAEKDFLKVTQLNPNSKDAEEAWDYLAKLKFQQQNYRTAANYYTRMLKFRPEDTQVFCNRAACKLLLNDYDGACKDCDKAIACDKDNGKAYALRAQVKLKLNDKAGACQDLKKAKKEGHKPAALMMKEVCE
jgi:tetratricopeptide (TPR) repeat protein